MRKCGHRFIDQEFKINPRDPRFLKGIEDGVCNTLNHFNSDPIYWEGVLAGEMLVPQEEVETVPLEETDDFPEVPVYLLALDLLR